MLSTITDATYRLQMTDEHNDRQIYCVITDANGRQVTTDVVTLSLIPDDQLQIISQPTTVEGIMNEFVSVELNVQGSDLSYKWYYKDATQTKFYTSSITASAYKVKMLPERNGRQV